jgi:ceramide synthetase
MAVAKAVEGFLVVAFIGESFASLAIAGRGTGSVLSPPVAAASLFALFPAMYFLIVVIKKFGRLVSSRGIRKLYVNEPERAKNYETKFADQSWQLAVHVSLSALAYYILELEDGGTGWLTDARRFWVDEGDKVNPSFFTVRDRPEKASAQLLYLLQAAVWVVTAFSHVWLESRHNDYLMMLTHHVVTLALIILSYHYNFVRLGVVIMFLHDSTDIVIDMLKLANYLKLEGASSGFLVEICFLTNFATWAYARLYLYPVHVIWRGVIVLSRELATAPGAPGMEAFTAAAGGNPYTRGHEPGYAWTRDAGKGKFDVFANIRALPFSDLVPMYYPASVFLLALALMNLIWYLMFWNILYKMAKGTEANEVGEEVYEGDREKKE